MALTKKKKRLILLVLGIYLVVSVGLAVMYKLQMRPFDTEEYKARRENQISDIETRLKSPIDGQSPDYEVTEDHAAKIRDILHEPGGSVMNVNLTLIMQIVNFAALMAILYLLLWEPLTRFLDERRQSIQDDIESAKNKMQEADGVLQEYRRKLHDARDEVASLIEDGRKRGEEKEREIIEEAFREVERIKQRTAAELRSEVEAARRQLRRDFAAVAVNIAEKILNREVKEEDYHAFVEEALQGLESEGVKF